MRAHSGDPFYSLNDLTFGGGQLRYASNYFKQEGLISLYNQPKTLVGRRPTELRAKARF
jgi:hypothetical protein